MISKLVSLIVGILIFLFSNLNADYHVGAIGGINFADLDAYVEGQSKKAEALPKPCGGLLFDIDLSEYFVLRCEPMYIPKGGNIIDAIPDSDDVEMEISCSYIELPIFFKTNHENPLNLYFLCGPVISYLLECDAEIDMSNSPQGEELPVFSTDLMNVTKNFDFGIGIGWGFKVPTDKLDIFAEMRYTRGLTNARKTGLIDLKPEVEGIPDLIEFNENDNRYANQGLQLLMGITFTL
ncbi:MAG: hypothetical protein B1H06_05810 [Candidatus Cloacimonas sp. 4484_143]|nr:MAG: hypothetical protein B1H06_05810 [Candidatus Cloacimonas sp. 4484_143]